MRDEFEKSNSAKTKNPHPNPGSSLSSESLTRAADRLQDCLDALPKVLLQVTLRHTAEFLASEPPNNLSQRHRVFIAGLAELLCHQLNLPTPAWTEKAEYFLSAEWDVRATSAHTEESDLAPPEFRRRKIRF
ncbi:MAG: hypothetical protein JWO20_513 [Candidatus Angelobacter sp.]|nr:hypothetical protein [Candidatus Angelobacter sp.]